MNPGIIGVIATQSAVTSYVEMIWDNIKNVPVGDPTQTGQWAIAFFGEDLGQFTQALVDGNKVTLIGVSEALFSQRVLSNNIHLVSFINNGAIKQLEPAAHGFGCFSGCVALSVIKFLSDIFIPDETFKWPDSNSAFTVMDFRGANNIDSGAGAFGLNAFTGISGNEISLILPVTILNNDPSISPLIENNTVTISNP